MKVDTGIVKAIEAYLEENQIGYRDFADKLGLSPAAITKWRKVGNGITPMRWRKLFPLIKPYLPKDRIYIDDAGHEQYSSNSEHQSGYVFEPKFIPIMVPTFTLKQIAKFDDTLESVMQFGTKSKAPMVEYRPKHADKNNVFALTIDDDSMFPILPKESRLFVCASERPVDGSLVAVMPVDQEPFIGRYSSSKGEYSITQIVGGRSLSGKSKDARTAISWIFPVLYYEVVTF